MFIPYHKRKQKLNCGADNYKSTLRSVDYLRYSSYGQNETSIEGQRKVNNEFLERYTGSGNQKLVKVGEYVDRARTGRTDLRKDFQRMLSDAKQGLFDVVIVYKLDRFGRNKYEIAINRKALVDSGVKLLSATEPINSNSPESILLESMLEGYSQFFSEELSVKVKRGNATTRENGCYTGGKLMLGYDVIDEKLIISNKPATQKRVVVNEKEALIVKRILTNT